MNEFLEKFVLGLIAFAEILLNFLALFVLFASYLLENFDSISATKHTLFFFELAYEPKAFVSLLFVMGMYRLLVNL